MSTALDYDSIPVVGRPRTAIVLGAGASRAVAYARKGGNLSPLDADFFDLLGRLRHLEQHQEEARKWILREVELLSQSQRESLERAFYTLHLRALMAESLKVDLPYSVETVVLNFVMCVDATLRAAHATNTCKFHTELFAGLNSDDVILTFNYDLVAERAMRAKISRADDAFDPGIYGFDGSLGYTGPLLLKLHGSSNWILDDDVFAVRTKLWSKFDESPNYRAALGGRGTRFAVFLPFWEKRIETAPWLSLWSKAMGALARIDRLIVWGYSLPLTDIRTEQLFKLGIGSRAIDLCVIDPSQTTRSRWRGLIPAAKYWQYAGIDEYLAQPPEW